MGQKEGLKCWIMGCEIAHCVMRSYSISNQVMKSRMSWQPKNSIPTHILQNIDCVSIHWTDIIHDIFSLFSEVHHVRSQLIDRWKMQANFLLLLVQILGISAKLENGREIIYSVVSGSAHLPCNITPPQGKFRTFWKSKIQVTACFCAAAAKLFGSFW